MRRSTQQFEAPFSVLISRAKAIEALNSIVQHKEDLASLEHAAESIDKAGALIGEHFTGRKYQQFAKLLSIITHLLKWARAVRSAEVDAIRYLRAAKQISKDLSKELEAGQQINKMSETIAIILAVEQIEEIEEVARHLLGIPLPLPIFARPAVRDRPSTFSSAHGETVNEISVAFVSFSLDGASLNEGHPVQPAILHDLTIEVRVSRWPEKAKELILDVISVEPAELYELPRFSFIKPDGEAPYFLSGTGRMLLQVAQTLLSRPLEFSYRAWFLPEDSGVHITVEGQRHLRIQSYDPVINPQTGYREVDHKLIYIRGRARSFSGVRDRELADFLAIMCAIGRIAGQSLQDNIFPGEWSERAFQEKMKEMLRADPRIGSELEEHPHAAGGITDLSFRGIRIELKVEDGSYLEIKDTLHFLGQSTQYVAGSDRRFGILCVLDCFKKQTAPGSVANDIDLQDVPPPGDRGGIPLLMGVVIIRGNLARPSDLSR